MNLINNSILFYDILVKKKKKVFKLKSEKQKSLPLAFTSNFVQNGNSASRNVRIRLFESCLLLFCILLQD